MLFFWFFKVQERIMQGVLPAREEGGWWWENQGESFLTNLQVFSFM